MLSYKSQIAWALGLLAFSIVYSLALHFTIAYKQGASSLFAVEYGAAIWLLGGVLALIAWVFTNFRSERVYIIYTAWTIFIVVADLLAAVRLYGTHWTLFSFG